MSEDSFIDWLNSLPAEIEGKTSVKEATRFPCPQCAGTGKWSGGVNRHGNSDCLSCRGKGYFTTSPRKRQASAEHRAQKKSDAAEALRRSIKDFSEEHPAMFEDLMKGRTEFTASLRDQLLARGRLSESQIGAWQRGYVKLQAIIAARSAATDAKGGEADLSRIREMFNAALESGHKKPVYRAEGLKITLAGQSSRNAGCLYVVEIADDAYQGKVDGVTFKAVRETKSDVLARLQAIAANPLEAAVRYGRQTGTCSCCGRELTNKASIEAGIGPICAQKWGF